jgi:hypothetical protein
MPDFEIELAGAERYGGGFSRENRRQYSLEVLTIGLGYGRFERWLASVASAGDGDNFSVMEQTVEDGTGCVHIA